MSEILTKSQRIGILLHNKVAPAVAAVSPVFDTSEAPWTGAGPAWTENFFGMACIPGSVKFNPGTAVENKVYTSSDSVFQEINRVNIDDNGSLPTIDFEAYATPKVMGVLASLAFQEGTFDDVATGKLKQFKPADGVLDFAGDSDGFLASIVIETDIGGTEFSDIILNSCVLNTLTYTFDNAGSGEARLLKVSGQFIGKTSYVGKYTGTTTAPETQMYNDGSSDNDGFTLDLIIGSETISDMCWRRASVTINNNITSDCFASTGFANNLKRVNPTIEWNIDIPYNTSTNMLTDSFTDGDVITKAEIYNGHAGTVVPHLKLACNSGYLTENPANANEGDYVANSLVFQQFVPAAGWAVVVELADDADYDGMH